MKDFSDVTDAGKLAGYGLSACITQASSLPREYALGASAVRQLLSYAESVCTSR